MKVLRVLIPGVQIVVPEPLGYVLEFDPADANQTFSVHDEAWEQKLIETGACEEVVAPQAVVE